MERVRAAVFRRMSHGLDDEDWKERQLQDGIALAERMGGTVAPEDVYTDYVSASRFAKKERPDYLRLLKAIEAPDGPRIVVSWMEDRLHRQILELAEFIDICRKHNVRVATPNAEYDLDDPDQLTMWYIKVRFAEAEVEKLSKRSRRERLQAAQKGEPTANGTRHFGFQIWVKSPDGRIVPGNAVPMRQLRQEQELIKEGVARILAGDTLRGIVQDWNARGIKTTKGNHWERFTFRNMITSPTIAGLREHRPVLNDGRRTKRGEGALYPAQWAPIVPREDWEAVVRILSDPARKHSKRGRGVSYLLTGMIYCGVCGGRMYARPNYGRQDTSENPERRYYSCVSNVVPRMARMVHLVDREVEKRFFHRLKESQQFADAASAEEEDPTRPLYNELARLKGLLDRLEDKVADELIKPATAKRKRAEYEQEMDRLRDRLASLAGERVRARIPDNLEEVWPDLSLDRRRAILATEIDSVVVMPLKARGSTRFDPNAIIVLWRNRKADPAALTSQSWWPTWKVVRPASRS
jgi:site-specific DNA recombinase